MLEHFKAMFVIGQVVSELTHIVLSKDQFRIWNCLFDHYYFLKIFFLYIFVKGLGPNGRKKIPKTKGLGVKMNIWLNIRDQNATLVYLEEAESTSLCVVM